MKSAELIPRTVLFAYPYAEDGRDAVSRYITDLRDGLESEGLKSRVVALRKEQLRLEAGRFARLTRIANQIAFYAQLAATILVAPKPVTVVTVDVPSAIGLVPQAIKRITGNRVRDISWVMDLYRLRGGVHPPEADEPRSVRARWELKSLRDASVVVTIGNCMRRLLDQHDVTDVLTVPIWTTQGPLDDGHIRADGPLRLLYSGSAREIHPLGDLLQAVAQLQALVELRIVGRGSEIDAAAAFAQANGLTNVVVTGLVPEDELNQQYAAADVHVVSLASSATGTCVPSKTYSAMGAGRAVLYIGDASGQAARDVRASRGGVVVTANTACILSALQRLARDRSEVRAMSLRAAEFAHRDRSRSTAAARWSQILRGSTK
ncbi:glycosyltransferase [Microbacterium sp. Leaf203]|uniref:glycosyltransferase n=1 Tax=Microbacterium sp. Leaf203 TaxID=1735677 RepID=UPI000A699536|nr:glycosyltransferase [Microbacterium sp. Leaf203]